MQDYKWISGLSILFASDLTFPMIIRGRNGFNFLLPSLSFAELYIHDNSSATHAQLESYSWHYLGFEKLSQLLSYVNNFSVGMVSHKKNQKAPEAPAQIL